MRAKKIILAFLVLMVVMVLVGCAQLPSLLPSPTPTPKTGPQVLIKYHRSGGFAGVSEDLIIYDDYKVVFAERGGRREFTSEEERVNQLIKRLEEAKFSTLESEYLSEKPGADFFMHEISYKGHTVKAISPAVPVALFPVLESLNEIIQSQKG